MFFNFSKLVALESNINNNNFKPTTEEIIKTGLKRSRSFHASLAIPTVNLNNLDQDLKEIKTNTKTEHISKEQLHQKLEVFGDHDIYKALFPNGFNDTREADWLQLPDEIWLKVLKMLKQNDLANFGLTCKKFQKLYLDGSLCK